MNISEIIKRRRYGRTRIHYSNEIIHDLNGFLQLNGLLPNKDDLYKIELQRAENIITSLLHKGLAYSEEYMPMTIAQEYTEYLLNGIIESKYQCYTNGYWDELYVKSNGFGWYSMTDSTFDGGVVITSDDIHFCFWVEEED